jgi:hypothetical protein
MKKFVFMDKKFVHAQKFYSPCIWLSKCNHVLKKCKKKFLLIPPWALRY